MTKYRVVVKKKGDVSWGEVLTYASYILLGAGALGFCWELMKIISAAVAGLP